MIASTTSLVNCSLAGDLSPTSRSISSNFLDEIYITAKSAGAIGGKLLGAGGGGFFVFYVDEDKHEEVRKSLSNYAEVKFNFENYGSRIILND